MQLIFDSETKILNIMDIEIKIKHTYVNIYKYKKYVILPVYNFRMIKNLICFLIAILCKIESLREESFKSIYTKVFLIYM